MSPMTAIAKRPHRVTLQNPGPATPTPDGPYTQTWADLEPPQLWMRIEPATARALEQVAAGAVLGLATHLLTGPYHPQIAAKTRAIFRDRIFEITHVQNPAQADQESVLVAVEVLSEPAAGPK